jgi:tetratricopeptide (TPR) repeat protein
LSSNEGEQELVLNVSRIQPLLEFECSIPALFDTTDATTWKDYGDQLLKLGDASSAVPYYEQALHITNDSVQIGATVLISSRDSSAEGDTQEAHPKCVAAEIDCLEGNQADVTYISSGEEATIPLEQVKLSVSLSQSELQVRILLNLARCLLQLADMDKSVLSRPSRYRTSAVMSCSMARCILQVYNDETLQLTALLLESKGQAARGHWQAALQSVDQLLQLEPTSRQGRRWKHDLIQQIQQNERANKKLVKSMCRWIQTATTNHEQASVSNQKEQSNLKSKRNLSNENKPRTDATLYHWSPDWIIAILILLASMYLYKWIQKP